MSELRVIISGGGTGGHIFPAISIADAIKRECPEAKILFVGAEGRMEMTRVPAAGYEIKGLPICGFDRKRLWRNISVLYKIWKSGRIARRIIKDFKPDVAIGVGGYASGPMLNACANAGVPCLIQEQNSYAGVTNKVLGRKVQRICVAYEGMERFFPKDKLLITGNPVREAVVKNIMTRSETQKALGLLSDKKTILIIGGSLGARTLNESVLTHLGQIAESNIQVLWQTGKYYSESIRQRLSDNRLVENLKVVDFISDMGTAYKAADLVISRAGAGSISELCLTGKPVILVPSPNVAEDHQTKNAMTLVEKNAALMVKDAEAIEELIPLAINTVMDDNKLRDLSKNILALGVKDSAQVIAKEAMELTSYSDKGDIEKQKDDRQNVFFLGIGGIGMSAIARYYLHKGYKVAGYDRVSTKLTRELEAEGAEVHYEDEIEKIPVYCKDKESTLVIYTPAIPKDSSELGYFREKGFDIQKRSEVLGTLTRQNKGLCFAGTHGKTSTSTMCAHIMNKSHVGCNAFLGGISKNYGTNYILSKDSPYVVIEADEFDRSFHRLSPYISVVTSADADHLDIYGTEEAYFEGFSHYTSLTREGGILILHKGLRFEPRPKTGVKVYTYSMDEGDFRADNIRVEGGKIIFDFISPIENVSNIELGHPVWINIENSVVAMAVSQLAGCTAEELREGVKTYEGVNRRFDFKIVSDALVFLSDYAHHPKEIEQSAKSLRKVYSDRRITVLFQPHLYTRTRDFYKDFAEALNLFDEVVLTEIYPARELPIEGVTSKLIYDNLSESVDKTVISSKDVIDFVESRDFDVLVLMGAGDLDERVSDISQALLKGKG